MPPDALAIRPRPLADLNARPAQRLVGDVTGYAWRPKLAPPRATVILVHGLQSHAGWFLDAGDRLAYLGLAVYAPDRAGSGASPAPRGDIADYHQWITDLAGVVRLARTEHPDPPVHLVGHCFGANLCLALALDPDAADLRLRSIAMLTPGLYVLPAYNLLTKVRIGLAALIAPRSRFRVPQDDDLFSRDPAVLAWLAADTRGARRVTARTLFQIDRMLSALRRDLPRLDVPVLVLEAAHDRLSDNRRNRLFLTSVLGDRCHWRTFDAEHFLLAEPCHAEVIDAIDTWTTNFHSNGRH